MAVPHAAFVLRPNRKICSYSPCIEQAMKTCKALRESGFHSIKTLESRLKTYDVRYTTLGLPDFGDPPAAQGACHSQPMTKLMPNADKAPEDRSCNTHSVDGGDEVLDESDIEGKELPPKKRARDIAPTDSCEAVTASDAEAGSEWLVAKAIPLMRGHTAFLTFAVRSSAHASAVVPDGEAVGEAEAASSCE